MNVVSLCSGVGLIDLGLEWAGYRTVQFCEINPFGQRILAERFPGVPIHDDAWTIQPAACDVIAAGFPCQPFSVAGKGLGADDPRHLWPAIIRAIRLARPRYVILENVPGLSRYYTARRSGDTCVCGWSDRRRGLRLHREVTRTGARATGRRRNVKGRVGSAPDAQAVRWDRAGIAAGDGDVGGSVHVDGHRNRGGSVPGSGLTVLEDQAPAGRARFAVSGDPRLTGAGWWDAGKVDPGGSGSLLVNTTPHSGDEQEGPLRRSASWRRVCDSCGRRMGRPTVELVRRSGLGDVLGDLADAGFDAEWAVFSAADVGAPHLRRRVWIVATSDADSVRVWDEHGGFFREGWGTTAIAWAHGQARPMADTDGARELQQGGFVGDEWGWSGDGGPEVADAAREREREPADEAHTIAGGRRSWPEFGGRSIGIGRWWSTERGLDRVAHGVPARLDRLAALGNGVVPQCAELVGLRLRMLADGGA